MTLKSYPGVTVGKKSKLRQLSESEKGYVAGILDGEGHFYVTSHYEGTSFSRIRVRITEKCVTDYLTKITKIGRVSSYIPKGRRKDGGPKKKIYEWTVGRRVEVRDLLLAIKPYLVLKKAHADLLLELESLKDQGSLGHEDVLWIKGEISKRNGHK